MDTTNQTQLCPAPAEHDTVCGQPVREPGARCCPAHQIAVDQAVTRAAARIRLASALRTAHGALIQAAGQLDELNPDTELATALDGLCRDLRHARSLVAALPATPQWVVAALRP